MINDIISLPLTDRVLDADQRAVINLWYAGEQIPDTKGWGGAFPRNYKIKINPCGSVRGGTFPSQGKPLRAFSYTNNFSISTANSLADFASIDGKVVVSELDLFPYEKERSKGEALEAFIPEELNTGKSRSFSRIWIQTNPDFMEQGLVSGSTDLTLWIPEDATLEERNLYEELSKALPGTERSEPIGWKEIMGVTFAVTDEGKLKVVGCK